MWLGVLAMSMWLGWLGVLAMSMWLGWLGVLAMSMWLGVATAHLLAPVCPSEQFPPLAAAFPVKCYGVSD